MRARQSSTVLLALFCGLVTMISRVSGDIVYTPSLSIATEVAFPVSATDLINQGTPTLDHDDWQGYMPQYGTTTATLNNGAVGANGVLTDVVCFDGATPKGFYFLKGSTLGYDVTAINTFAGWGDGRINQAYAVYYLKAGETYGGSGDLPHLLTTVLYNPGSQSVPASTKVSLTDSTGTLLSGITAIEFKFADNGEHGAGVNSTAYRELDVVGQATVPEPGTLALLAVGLLSLLAYAWRK